MLKKKNTPIPQVVNKADVLANTNEIAQKGPAARNLAQCAFGQRSNGRGALLRYGPRWLLSWGKALVQQDFARHLAGAGGVVLLVMPRGIKTKRGAGGFCRRCRPYATCSTAKALVLSCTTDCMDGALAALKGPPKLIITDS